MTIAVKILSYPVKALYAKGEEKFAELIIGLKQTRLPDTLFIKKESITWF